MERRARLVVVGVTGSGVAGPAFAVPCSTLILVASPAVGDGVVVSSSEEMVKRSVDYYNFITTVFKREWRQY